MAPCDSGGPGGRWSLFDRLTGQQRHEISQRHRHPLGQRIAGAVTLVHDHATDRFIVARLDSSLAGPRREIEPDRVLAFDDDPVPSASHTGDVAPISRTCARSTLDAVVVQRARQRFGDLALEPGARQRAPTYVTCS